MTPKRKEATEWLTRHFPRETGQKRSDILKDGFREFTNHPHAYFIEQWKANSKETSCKDFTIRYCNIIGMAGELGGWNAKKCLNRLDKSYAWVDSTPNNVPEIGDICFWSNGFHVGVSMGADIGMPTDSQWSTLEVTTWYSVEGGQDQIIRDGKGNLVENRSFAWVKWKKYPDSKPALGGIPTPRYAPSMLQGWISLDRYFYGDDPEYWPDLANIALQDELGEELWVNREGEIVHPNAPDGAGGPGYFCSAGSLATDPFKHGLPHPLSPTSRYIDPLKLKG